MERHQFTLIVEGPDLQGDQQVAALLGAGCDDALIGKVGSVQYLDFDREAGTYAEAVFEAVASVEHAVPGARVIQLAADDLVTMAEIAELTGRSRESIRLLIAGERGPGSFPTPATHFRTRNRMWRWMAVAAWFAVALDEPQSTGDPGLAQFIVAFNSGLAFRNDGESLSGPDATRIRDLAFSEPPEAAPIASTA